MSAPRTQCSPGISRRASPSNRRSGASARRTPAAKHDDERCVWFVPDREPRTKGGEARPMNSATPTDLISPAQDTAAVHDGAVRSSTAWHALWTRSHCEQLVHDQLAAKGFDLFLPKIEQDRKSTRLNSSH